MSVEEDRASVEHVLNDWDRAFNDNALAKILSLVTEDFELIPPDEAPVQGASARRLLEAFLEFDMNLDMSILELVVSGDNAFSKFRYRLELTPKTGGEATVLSGHGLHLLRREPSGIWMIAKVSWSEEE